MITTNHISDCQIDDSTTASSTMRRLAYLVNKHAPKLLRIYHGTEHYRAPIEQPRATPLTDSQKSKIRALHLAGVKPFEIARRAGCKYCQVSYVISGGWKKNGKAHA